MKILEVASLAIPEIKVIRFARFRDHRGFFSQHYRESDFQGHEGLGCLRGIKYYQMNESFSRPGTIRGMHFQLCAPGLASTFADIAATTDRISI
jgi:dTDP-4-dehydrorhamnose 3,5-epimerase